jgi:CheY-like chemotaxis protein
VANGLEVLDALERERYDLVLMDIQMPEMDGLEATRQIRRRWNRAEYPLRIIAMTAYAYATDLDRCLEAGMDGYLPKPVRIDSLREILSQGPQLSPHSSASGPQPGSPAESELDHSRMQDLVDSLGDGLRDVIESYLEETPVQIDDMRAAVERGDFDDLQRMAHSLRSSSGIFGAREIVELCRELESPPRPGLAGSREGVEAVAGAYARLRGVLTVYLPAEQ